MLRSLGCCLACLVPLAWTVSCAGTLRRAPSAAPAGATMGVYRAAIRDAGEEERRFRLLLWAAPPDHIHGEILSPIGATEVIVDGGGGLLSVAFPKRRRAYAGRGDRDTLQKLIGVRLTLEELLAGLWSGEVASGGWTVRREPSGRQGLPRRLEIRGAGGGGLTLRLKRLEPLRVSTRELGTGTPPAGMEVEPLQALEPLELGAGRGSREEAR